MENPLVSVIIPIYNSEEYLMECLLSVKNQSYVNLEIIFIDDGSTDGSRLICQEIIVCDDRFYFYRMHGESACHGKYNVNQYTEVLAWIKVRELFSGEKRILRKINSIFGCILLGHVIGIKK